MTTPDADRRHTRSPGDPDRPTGRDRRNGGLGRPGRRAALLVTPVLVLGSCSGATVSHPPPQPTPTALHVIAVGDSITEADSEDFDDADIGPGSWAASTDGNGIQVLGGWAHAGATSADMLAGLVDRLAAAGATARPDVLVIMAGNNDVDAAVPFRDVARNLVDIAALVNAPRVVLSTIAPEDDVAGEVARFNARLPALARQEGWQLVDPMGAVGDGRGHYLPGMSDDGVHPTAEGARLIGAALRSAVVG